MLSMIIFLVAVCGFYFGIKFFVAAYSYFIFQSCLDFLNLCDELFNAQKLENFSKELRVRVHNRRKLIFYDYEAAMRYIILKAEKIQKNLEALSNSKEYYTFTERLRGVLHQARLWIICNND